MEAPSGEDGCTEDADGHGGQNSYLDRHLGGSSTFPKQREFHQDDCDIFGEGVHQLVAGLCLPSLVHYFLV